MRSRHGSSEAGTHIIWGRFLISAILTTTPRVFGAISIMVVIACWLKSFESFAYDSQGESVAPYHHDPSLVVTPRSKVGLSKPFLFT